MNEESKPLTMFTMALLVLQMQEDAFWPHKCPCNFSTSYGTCLGELP